MGLNRSQGGSQDSSIALPVTAEDLAAYPSPVSSHSPIHGGAKKKKKMKKASRKSKLTQY